MKIALAQVNFHIGNFKDNADKVIDYIGKAKNQGADVVLFPELAVSGYPARDFLDFEHFVSCCIEEMEDIASHCHGITAIVGGPSFNTEPKGKHLNNSAYVLAKGEIQAVHHKMLLPNYDVFDEYRYFEPAKEVFPVEINGEKWALTICEDIWDIEEDSMYPQHPLDVLLEKHQVVGVLNIASSPFSNKQREARSKTLRAVYNKYQLPVVYVNQVGAQTELVFDGGSAVLDAEGNLFETPYFKEGLHFWNSKTGERQGLEIKKEHSEIAHVYEALVLGVRDYFGKLGFSKALLGLSGGIDSALTLAIAADALGAKNVLAVMMPSQFSSDHSVSDSERMIKTLGCPSYNIAIEPVFESFIKQLEEPFRGCEFGLAEENLQARIRGTLLMSISNKHGHILLNTSNKSEMAVGFGTIYGDMCGGLSVIGDVYKQDVYALSRYINRNGEIIPENIITKAPSAELRPGQLDSDRLPDYAVLDEILARYIEGCQDINRIIREMPNTDEAIIRKTLKLVNINEYKRHQTPPVLRVSTKAFGQGRRMPIVAKYLI